MKTLYFNCKLLSDVIISESAATEGHQQTLDFIPGNNFLGICASKLYKEENGKYDEKMLTLFHTGDVQFGDAHIKGEGIRTLRIPASFFYPKLKDMEEVCYIHHGYDRNKDTLYNGGPQQLKQCRTGFYAFKDGKVMKKEITTAYAIKSAYDYGKRRSQDKQMYGYESLEEGLEFLFQVDFSDKAEQFADIVKETLIGEKHVGRSKTAQYGLVEISEAKTSEFTDYSGRPLKDKDGKFLHTVYAESKLVFLDADSLTPTFQPEASDLGFDDGKIVWEKSQVRTFQYSPWNSHRKTRDADRCGIEKGSVFVVRSDEPAPSKKKVGLFKNEGFGKVIFNPTFLAFNADDNGTAVWKVVKTNETPQAKENASSDSILSDNPLLSFLMAKKSQETEDSSIMDAVNSFVKSKKSLFIESGDTFASQWGQIRTIAEQNSDENIEREINKYLDHGVAQVRWDECGGKIELMNFIKEKRSLGVKRLIINLASEMQKVLKNK